MTAAVIALQIIAGLLLAEAAVVLLLVIWGFVSAVATGLRPAWADPLTDSMTSPEHMLVSAGAAIAQGVPSWLVWPVLALGAIDGVLGLLYPPPTRRWRAALFYNVGFSLAPAMYWVESHTARLHKWYGLWRDWMARSWTSRPHYSTTVSQPRRPESLPAFPFTLLVPWPNWPTDNTSLN